MERRKFIRNITTGSLSLMALSSAALANQKRKVTILHTNDTHSHIDPFPNNHGKYPNKGGVERRMKMIHNIRSLEPNVLLFDAGDIFQGTPYFNIHGGELEFKLMSQMGYDAATMGNHDFDAGIEGFDKVLPLAKFPFLCSNYDFSDTILNHKTETHKIFKKDGIKIGVFGLGVELDGLVSPALFKETKYLDPILNGQKMADYLKLEEKCNLVICLSHLGYSPKLNKMCDTVLASSTINIDLIIGGHTHTFMEQVELHKNAEDLPVLINQVGWAGLVLGRLDFYFNDQNQPDSFSAQQLNTNYSLG